MKNDVSGSGSKTIPEQSRARAPLVDQRYASEKVFAHEVIDASFIQSYIAVHETVSDIARSANQTILPGYRQSFDR
jgi:hypothetical protein